MRTNRGLNSKGHQRNIKLRRITEINTGETWERNRTGYYVTIINIYDTAIHYSYNGTDYAMWRPDFHLHYHFYHNPVTDERYYQ